jgi:hypothetical protein
MDYLGAAGKGMIRHYLRGSAAGSGILGAMEAPSGERLDAGLREVGDYYVRGGGTGNDGKMPPLPQMQLPYGRERPQVRPLSSNPQVPGYKRRRFHAMGPGSPRGFF